MKTLHIFRLFTLGLLCLSLSSCGKKKKNIFFFKDKNEKKIRKLHLPSLYSFLAQKKESLIAFSWRTPSLKKNSVITYLGCNIYRFYTSGFIPKKPLNSQPLLNDFFNDYTSNKQSTCYLVRGVFLYKKKEYLGPASKVICLK